MRLVLELAVVGFALGSSYALIAVGFSLIYTVTRILHFAHAATFTVAAWTFYTVSAQVGREAGLPLLPSLVLGAVAAMVVATFLGVSIYLLVYRFMERRQASALMLFVASLAIVWIVESAVATLSSGQIAYVLSGTVSVPSFGLFGVTLTVIHLLAVVGALVCLVALVVFLRYTKLGLAVRGMSDTEELARVVGIRASRGRAVAFAVGSALAAPPAILLSLTGGITSYAGSGLVFRGIAATLMGGVGSIPGAIIAAYLLGLGESIPLAFVPSGWQTSMSFALFLIIILLRPRGLFGRRVASMKL